MVGRFISTCVEKIEGVNKVGEDALVHLHVRGENESRNLELLDAKGSSPRAWRKLPKQLVIRCLLRFISTCVEKI